MRSFVEEEEEEQLLVKKSTTLVSLHHKTAFIVLHFITVDLLSAGWSCGRSA